MAQRHAQDYVSGVIYHTRVSVFACAHLLFDLTTLARFIFNCQFQETMAAFKWDIPPRFNMGYACVDRHVASGYGDAVGLIHCSSTHERRYTFNQLKLQSDSLAVGTLA